MALQVKDRVGETSTTTGTGAFTLAAAIAGYRRFSAVCSTSDTVYYAIIAVDANGNPSGDWECGLGTYSSANTLTRTTVHASTNSNNAVNFAAGTKYVFLDATATYLTSLAATSSYGGWTELTFPGSTTSKLGRAVYVANETFTAAAGNKIEVEVELGKTSGSDLTVLAAVGSFGYYLACQGDGNNVLYRYLSGTATAINASGSDSRFNYTGIHVLKFVVNLQSSTSVNVHAVVNDCRLPAPSGSGTGWPVGDAPGAGMVGTVQIGLEGTIKRARARVIS